MRPESRRRASITREVLKEIISNDPPTAPATQRNPTSLDAIKLNEAVSFLERKIDRQYTEIKLTSEHLSREMSLKEELACLLGEERDKAAKTNLLLRNANKANG